MKVKLLSLKDPNRKIYAIKALRDVTMFGLKESKELVDDLCQGHQPEIIWGNDKTSADFDAAFEYQKVGANLKLWKVTNSTGQSSLVLASTQKLAEQVGGDFTNYAEEIAGPFIDGQELASWRKE